MNFSIGNDHAGVDYKEAIVSYPKKQGASGYKPRNRYSGKCGLPGLYSPCRKGRFF